MLSNQPWKFKFSRFGKSKSKLKLKTDIFTHHMTLSKVIEGLQVYRFTVYPFVKQITL